MADLKLLTADLDDDPVMAFKTLDEAGLLSDATPEADAGSGDAGTSPDASRGDHAHPAAGGGDALKATKTLTSADILAITTAPPVVLVPAVADKVIVPVSLAFVFNPVTTPYVPADPADAFYLKVGSNDFAASVCPFASFIEAVDRTIYTGPLTVYFSGTASAEGALALYGASDNPTGGDGTVDVTILYYLVDLP